MSETVVDSRLVREATADTAARSARTAPVQSTGAAPVGWDYPQLILVLGLLVVLGPLTIDTYLPALPRSPATSGPATPRCSSP